MFRVRTAIAADADSIARIHVSAWRTTYQGLMSADVLANLDLARRRQHWREVAETHPNELLILEGESAVLGFCHIAPARDADTGNGVGEITALYLDPSVTGRGYGRCLCDHALDQLRRQGYLEVVLWVLRDNHVARAFYERLGFAPDGACKHLERLQADGVRYRIHAGDRDSTA